MTYLPCIEIEIQPNPSAPTQVKTSLIMLHGLGANGQDFLFLTKELQLAAIGPVRFIFPHAPSMPVSINQGYVMPAWYDIIQTDLARQEDEAGLRASQAAIAKLIDRERERGISASRIVLAGFSQGCAMTLMTGLRYPERLAGLAGFSGYLPLANSTASERHLANQETPIFLAHGLDDTVVRHQLAQACKAQLSKLGYVVELFNYPMQHSVCPQQIQDFNQWLVRMLQIN